MQPLLLVALVMQVHADATVKRDSTGGKDVNIQLSVGTTGGENARRRAPKRIPLTEEHLRTAFRSPQARAILERARVARMAQDSALMSYDATAYMRISAGMGFSKIGRDRLVFRHENAVRVQWRRDVGAWVDVKGMRTAIPVAPKEAQEETNSEMNEDGDMPDLPYFPGQEPLIVFNGDMVKSSVDERDIVHPFAEGAEAYYFYEVGDSITFKLPDSRSIVLRELRIRPRRSQWNIVVGSMWFDDRTGQLVRGAYRFSVPMDVWAVVAEEDSTAKDEIPVWVKPLISPMRAQITAVAVEYGLYQGRFWLPRLRSAEGDAQVSFMHVPFRFEQSFKFTSVNAIDSLPSIQVAARPPEPPDSLSEADREKWRDSARAVRREQRRAARDSVRKGLKRDPAVCQPGDTVRTVTRERPWQGNLRVAVRTPCDLKALEHSPELPKSIFDEGEEIFGSKERDALIKEALAMGAQPPFSMGAIRPTFKWGLEYTRFNRIEGFSTGGLLEQQLGGGYTASLLGRFGVADREPNAVLTLARSNLTKTIRGRAYNRLVAASDWGNPLSFGSSLSALLFGRDEGFYYRTTGAEIELENAPPQGAMFTWRMFAERQRTAEVENSWSLGPKFIPNIAARTGQYAGMSVRLLHSHGLDPAGFRAFTDLRLEGAVSDSASATHGRGALDLALTQGVGPLAMAVTLSGGSSVGPLPAQRRWYLGGAHTVRGQRPDTALSGNAFWLGRAEIGGNIQAMRPVLFGDIGWVGDREHIRDVGRPMSGVGVGASIMDGLIRADLARGLYPQKRWRFDAYVEAKF